MEKFDNPQFSKEKLESLNDDQRKKLMNYLKDSSDSAIGGDLDIANKEEIEMAIKLIDLKLPSADWESSRHSTYSDSNFREDVEKREIVLKELGLNPDTNEIVRHNIVIENDKKQELHLKIINLMRKMEKPESEIKEILDNGVIFLGSISFEGGEPVYSNLDDKEKEFIKSYLEERK